MKAELLIDTVRVVERTASVGAGGWRTEGWRGREIVFSAVLLLGCAACGSHAQSGPVFREIAATDQAAPGLHQVYFETVGSPRLNASGKVLFWARLRGGSVTLNNEDSLWTDRDGALELIIRGGDPSTTGVGDYIIGFPGAAMDDGGFIALVTSFVPGGAGQQITRLAAYREVAGGGFLLRRMELATAYTLASLIPMGGGGADRFREDTSKNNSIISMSGAVPNLTPAAAVPGAGTGTIEVGATFRQFSEPGLNAVGRGVFLAAVGTLAQSANWRYALYSDRGGGLERIATVGEAPRGGPAQHRYVELGADPLIDDSGRIVYWAKIAEDGVPDSSDTAIHLDTPGGSSATIATSGEEAPGAEPGVFAGFSRAIGLGSGGRVAFNAVLSGNGVNADNNSGLWIADPGRAPRLLVREGDAVADVPGVRFRALGDPHVGPAGQIVITANLDGADSDQNARSALFATDARGVLKMVARVGRSFPLDAGSERLVRHIGFEHGGPGLLQMNGAGEIVFTLWFTDGGSAVYVGAFPCSADFNRDGGVDGGDVEAFFVAWEAAENRADVNEDGGVDGADVEAFFVLWEAGGC